MTRKRCLSPLVLRPTTAVGGVCSFSFLIRQGNTLREKHVANIHSIEKAVVFIERWKQQGGRVVDVRSLPLSSGEPGVIHQILPIRRKHRQTLNSTPFRDI